MCRLYAGLTEARSEPVPRGHYKAPEAVFAALSGRRTSPRRSGVAAFARGEIFSGTRQA